MWCWGCHCVALKQYSYGLDKFGHTKNGVVVCTMLGATKLDGMSLTSKLENKFKKIWHSNMWGTIFDISNYGISLEHTTKHSQHVI
jgi:hypothetical protein